MRGAAPSRALRSNDSSCFTQEQLGCRRGVDQLPSGRAGTRRQLPPPRVPTGFPGWRQCLKMPVPRGATRCRPGLLRAARVCTVAPLDVSHRPRPCPGSRCIEQIATVSLVRGGQHVLGPSHAKWEARSLAPLPPPALPHTRAVPMTPGSPVETGQLAVSRQPGHEHAGSGGGRRTVRVQEPVDLAEPCVPSPSGPAGSEPCRLLGTATPPPGQGVRVRG